MNNADADPYRDFEFIGASQGPVIAPTSGKTKISIRIDTSILEHFRGLADAAGGGNYQSLINDALRQHIESHSVADLVRKVVREELATYETERPSREAH